jgi:hypothetical protein
MTRIDLDRLRDVLWPPDATGRGGDVYALLDAARDPRIYTTLRRSLVDYHCLYAGAIPRELAEVAPYLVPLARNSPVTAELLGLGWGDAWGILVQSSAFLPDLRKHFRRFLRVQDESGMGLIFRFYDPRVLRAYLPTADDETIRQFFGPVERFFVEGRTAETLVVFRREGSRLQSATRHLAASPTSAGPFVPDDPIATGAPGLELDPRFLGGASFDVPVGTH